MKYFTVIDALNDYHQVLLSDESAVLTTLSSFGRYQYLHLPFGIVHAPHVYCHRVSKVSDDTSACRGIVQHVVVICETYEQHLILMNQL